MTSAESGIEERLADFVTSLTFSDLTDEETGTVERAFVDTVGVTVAGWDEPAARKVRDVVHGSEKFLGGPPIRPAEAGLAIGTASHALDYDDLSWSMDGHPSVSLVPTVLALANQTSASGSEAVTAYVAGYEVACAIAVPVSPTHYEKGWHATATIGSFAGAAAASHLLDLDRERVRHAIAIASSTASGLKANFGSMTKPLHAGLAVRDGITAALLARDGFTGGTEVINDDGGFWMLYADGPEDEFSIGEPRELDRYGLQIKAFPCCYYTHSAIAAAGALADEHNIDADSIDRIVVHASRAAADALQYAAPDRPSEAKFSMEYTVASSIVQDRVGLEAFEKDAIADDTVRNLRERVEFRVDEDVPYNANGARVRIETNDTTVEAEQNHPPGTYRNPLSETQLRRKFDECVRRQLDSEATATLYEWLSTLSVQPQLERIYEFS